MRKEFYDCYRDYPRLGFDQDEHMFIHKLLLSVFTLQLMLEGLRAGDLRFFEADPPVELDLLEAKVFRLTRKLYRLIRELDEAFEPPF